jgi:cytochrome b pre-mRNA-processing protein 3
MSLLSYFRHSPRETAAASLYRSLVEQARAPGFYGVGTVPDTLDGRFDMICLHAFLVLRRLQRDGAAGAELGQVLMDWMIADFDMNLRELGVSDYAIGHRMKAMAAALYGRIAAYEVGLAAGEATLKPALARNLFGTAPPEPAVLAAMARYVLAASAALDGQDSAALAAGLVSFPAWQGEAAVADHV